MKHLRMSTEEYRAHQNRYGRQQMLADGITPHRENKVSQKPSKHKNNKVYSNGVKVADSKREHTRYIELQALERAGKISDLKSQVVFELVPSVVLDGRKKPPIRYKADATYIKDGKLVVEDAKSPHLRLNPVYRMKKHLLKHVHNLDIMEV